MTLSRNQRMSLVYLTLVIDSLMLYIMNRKLSELKYKPTLIHVVMFFMYMMFYSFADLHMISSPNTIMNIAIRAIMWLCFLFVLSVSFNSLVRKMTLSESDILNVFGFTSIIFTFLSIIAVTETIQLSTLTYIFPFALLSILVVLIVRIIRGFSYPSVPTDTQDNVNTYLSYILIICFSYFLLYDTQKCYVGNTKYERDVIWCSNNIFINSLNIFEELMKLTED